MPNCPTLRFPDGEKQYLDCVAVHVAFFRALCNHVRFCPSVSDGGLQHWGGSPSTRDQTEPQALEPCQTHAISGSKHHAPSHATGRSKRASSRQLTAANPWVHILFIGKQVQAAYGTLGALCTRARGALCAHAERCACTRDECQFLAAGAFHQRMSSLLTPLWVWGPPPQRSRTRTYTCYQSAPCQRPVGLHLPASAPKYGLTSTLHPTTQATVPTRTGT